jgi:hypothetical protein
MTDCRTKIATDCRTKIVTDCHTEIVTDCRTEIATNCHTEIATVSQRRNLQKIHCIPQLEMGLTKPPYETQFNP